MSVLLVQADARRLPLADASVHCVVTSPPYFALRDYNVAGQIGLEDTPDAFVAALVGVFREVGRVLKPQGTCWVNMGDSYASGEIGRHDARQEANGHSGISYKSLGKAQGKRQQRPPTTGLPAKNLLGMPWRLALALQDDGWILRSEIIWHKPSAMPESVQDRPTRCHEQVFLFSKQPRYWYDAEAIREPQGSYADYLAKRGNNAKYEGMGTAANHLSRDSYRYAGRNARTVWTIPSAGFAGAHFATFPRELVRRCLLAGCPQQVCTQCGTPWVRQVERTSEVATSHNGSRFDVGKSAHHGHVQNGVRYVSHVGDFQPACRCSASTRPGVAFDPFCGSGTTLLVARELGLDAVGCDLSLPYLRDIARERLGLAALHAWTHGDTPRVEQYTDLPLFVEDAP